MAESLQSSVVSTVLHIEDEPFCAEKVARLLSRWPEVRHIGFTTSGRDGIALCRIRKPDIVLLDLWLPDMDGFAVANALNALRSPLRILVFSGRADDYALYRAWSGGVAGFVWKAGNCVEQLRAAFAAIAMGRRYLPPEVLEAIRRFRSSPDAFHKILSAREQSLVAEMASGASDAEIALQNELSPDTVHSHRQNIFKKLNVHRTEDLMRWAAERGFTAHLRAATPCVASV